MGDICKRPEAPNLVISSSVKSISLMLHKLALAWAQKLTLPSISSNLEPDGNVICIPRNNNKGSRTKYLVTA